MSTQETTDQTPLIPSERVDELAQLIKDSTTTPLFSMRINDTRKPSLVDTKLGGLPYWPSCLAYPTTKKGEKLMMLAQLNLADFGGCDRLPQTGLLQFFVDSDDDCSGMDFDDGTNQNGFRVVWHEAIDPRVTEDFVRALDVPTSFDSWDDRMGNPLTGEFALDVEESTGFINPAVEGFDEVFLDCCEKLLGKEYVAGRDDWYDCLARPDSDRIFDLLGVSGPLHQVFGYPFFTQSDPRYRDDLKDLDTLLLQIDSDNKDHKDRVLWGDVGIGGFFINGEALRRGDFSRVLFNWDCY